MIRFDFATGVVTTGRGRTASVPDGVVDRLAAIGRHIGHVIVPSAVAKDILEPGIVASPDGRRIFALGIGGEDTGFGSTGVDAFDADTLAPLWHAEPTADFSSIAINADGTAVYVSAPGGIAPDGSGSPDNGASITVFDSARGEVRLLAGQIGQPGTHDLLFTEPVLR
jgi:DNA-binding beta-propeller fold protein YncE